MKRRTLTRAGRKWLTERTMDVAVAAAPWMRPWAVDAVEALFATAGPRLPVLAGTVGRNMRSVGIDSQTARRDYFARLGRHFADELRILSCVHDAEGGRSGSTPQGLAHLARVRVQLDASFDRLREAVSLGRGVILMYPHTVDSSLVQARLMQEVPLTVVMRESKDPSRRRAKDRWCKAIGFDYVMRQDRGNEEQTRVHLVERLRQGRVMVIAPDLPQKRQKGRPVRFFDRAIFLPRGAAILSQLTGAPLITMLARPRGRDMCLVMHGPLMPETSPRAPGARQTAIQYSLQWFADHLADFIRAHPSLWYFWGDKRWTRVFRNDPQYVSSVEEAPAERKMRSACSTETE